MCTSGYHFTIHIFPSTINIYSARRMFLRKLNVPMLTIFTLIGMDGKIMCTSLTTGQSSYHMECHHSHSSTPTTHYLRWTLRCFSIVPLQAGFNATWAKPCTKMRACCKYNISYITTCKGAREIFQHTMDHVSGIANRKHTERHFEVGNFDTLNTSLSHLLHLHSVRPE